MKSYHNYGTHIDKRECLGHRFLLFAVLNYLFLVLLPTPVQSQILAIQFNGTSQLRSPLSITSSSSFTVEFWIKSSIFAQTSQIFYCGMDSSRGFGLSLTSDLVPGQESYASLVLGGISTIATGNSFRVPFQQWIHVAITRKPGEWKLYKNGALVGRSIDPGIGPDSIMTIGSTFNGSLARLRLWKTELTQSEIVHSMCSAEISDSSLLSEFSADTAQHLDSLFDHLGNNPSFYPTDTVGAMFTMDFPVYSPPPPILLTQFPSHMQFFARDSRDSSLIQISGNDSLRNVDSMVLDLYKNDSLIERLSQTVNEPFHFDVTIHSELSLYTVRLFAIKGTAEFFIAEAADILSGDVFLIDGQSNAHPGVDGYTWQNAFSRTLGIQTATFNFDPYDPADTLWGLSFGTGQGQFLSGPYFVGAWARWMQEGVANAWHVPTCVINGAAGGSTIAEHFRNDQQPLDLTTIYGRLLYRLMKSGLQNNIRVFFWYQGEWDSGSGYLNSFRKLYNSWLENYPIDSTPRDYFIFQTRPDICDVGDGQVREALREIPDSLPYCHSISTTAIDGYDGCHYYWYGYVAIGQQALREVGKYLYHSSDTSDVDPPDIATASYTTSLHQKIAVTFRTPLDSLLATPDTLFAGKLRRIQEAFHLDGKSGAVDSVMIQGDTLYLELSTPSSARFLSYTPDRTYDGDTAVYQGPWLVNSRGVGALTFYNIPIGQAPLRNVLPESNLTSDFRIVQSDGSPSASILILLRKPGKVKIEIIDLLGRQRSTVIDEYLINGSYVFPLSAILEPSMYIAVLSTREGSKALKFLVPL